MRRLLRRIFNGAAVVSAALFVACVVLWVGSYLRPTAGAVVRLGSRRWVTQSQAGFAAVEYMDVALPPPVGSVYTVVGERGLDVPGFALVRARIMRWTLRPGQRQNSDPPPVPPTPLAANATVWRLHCNYPPVCLAILVLPALWVTLWFRRLRPQRTARRRAEGRCVSCGYDLHATPGRCPECGAVAAEGEST